MNDFPFAIPAGERTVYEMRSELLSAHWTVLSMNGFPATEGVVISKPGRIIANVLWGVAAEDELRGCAQCLRPGLHPAYTSVTLVHEFRFMSRVLAFIDDPRSWFEGMARDQAKDEPSQHDCSEGEDGVAQDSHPSQVRQASCGLRVIQEWVLAFAKQSHPAAPRRRATRVGQSRDGVSAKRWQATTFDRRHLICAAQLESRGSLQSLAVLQNLRSRLHR